MADMKTLNTRIKLKYDLHTEWMKPEKDPVLLAGEIAIAKVETAQTDPDTGLVNYVPSILMKVGDGEHKYSELGFTYARSADVSEWAKAASKPVYAATEITGIDAYIAAYVNEQMGISVDTDTQYQIVADGVNSFKLQSKGKTDETWADVEGSTFTVDFTTVNGKITAIEENIGEINFAEEFAKYELAGAAATEAGKVQTALDEYKETNDEAVKANTDAIAAIVDGDNINTFKAVETAIAGIHQAAGDYATKTEAQGYADAKDEAIAAAKKAGDDAQAGVNALNTKVDLAEGETVKGLIETAKGEAISAATAHVEGVTDRLDAIEDNIGETNIAEEFAKYETLANANEFKAEVAQYKTNNDARVKAIEDDYLTSADKTSLQDQINLIMENPDTEGVKNSINEFTQYITDHGTIAEGFRTDIDKNKEDIAAITADYLKTADKTELSGLIGGLDTRLGTAEGEIDALQTDIVTKATKDELNAVAERLPEGAVADYVTEQLTPVTNSITTLDNSLANIAKTGNIDDLVQTANTYIVFDCGTASTVI